MAELSIPFNSTPIDGKEDRVYEAKDFAAYFKQFIGNGVYPNPSNGLRVDASGTNLVLTIHEGSAFINGHSYVLYEEPLQFAVSPAHMSYNRKDSVVVQLNHTERAIGIKYKEGAASSNPLPPVLVRTDDIHELRLAEVLVRSGARQLTQADISDTRLDKTLCGMVTNVVTSVDTTALYNQYQTYLNQQITAWNASKTQQNNAFLTQMSAQQQTFIVKSTAIDAWYSDIRTNINKTLNLDFDNLLGMPGCVRVTKIQGSGFKEVIQSAFSDKKVAERVTTTSSSGSVETINVYQDNGLTIWKTLTITTTKTGDGFQEVIVG